MAIYYCEASRLVTTGCGCLDENGHSVYRVEYAVIGYQSCQDTRELETILFDIITQYYKVELSALKRYRKLIVGVVMLCKSALIPQRVLMERQNQLRKATNINFNLTASISVDLAPYTVFLLYLIIAMAKDDTQILTIQAFTTLSLISILTSPLMSFIQSLPTPTYKLCLVQTNPKLLTDNIELSKVFVAAKSSRSLVLCEKLLSFHNAFISWTRESAPVL
ncbi:ABC transporter integral membrane type 1 [Penicillium malachiteum]|uniref:ABC transporter integral membrane type 1 n=1 Tax=Penicillium malachiteum TaxID=1324776 RepID=A0AAD6HCY1_9EURO|nr:ABC transporter integral membrane type 1 [Penicillium malachiteum]